MVTAVSLDRVPTVSVAKVRLETMLTTSALDTHPHGDPITSTIKEVLFSEAIDVAGNGNKAKIVSTLPSTDSVVAASSTTAENVVSDYWMGSSIKGNGMEDVDIKVKRITISPVASTKTFTTRRVDVLDDVCVEMPFEHDTGTTFVDHIRETIGIEARITISDQRTDDADDEITNLDGKRRAFVAVTGDGTTQTVSAPDLLPSGNAVLIFITHPALTATHFRKDLDSTQDSLGIDTILVVKNLFG